ncbi:hypothetical protein VNI00_010213 [Paramarasmius palmivorus]|uniref:Uncharacterized protein n=1 Tax=Paramarasmius palmivorus TaxID=297713 RepID=A0AAW0BUR4_9AGAR
MGHSHRVRGIRKLLVATIIGDIWPGVLFVASVATMVVLVSENTETQLAFKSSLLTVLGLVVGLVISFRTSSAYERYQEGARMWNSIAMLSRNIAQMIWIHVPHERSHKEGQRETSVIEAIVEKRTMVKLVEAFSVSVKHYLRGESGVDYEDLYPLVCFLPRYANNSYTISDLLPMWSRNPEVSEGTASIAHSRSSTLVSDSSSTIGEPVTPFDSKETSAMDQDSLLPTTLKPASIPPEMMIIRVFKRIGRLFAGPTNDYENVSQQQSNVTPEANIPFEIILYLQSYTNHVITAGLAQPAIATALVNTLGMMQDTLSNLNRIKTTPLPFAYQVHLRMSIWIYLFFLPFQIYTDLGFLTIPASAFAAFLFLGFLEIGQEIENPFNYDANDLDLDGFCLSIRRELHQITAHISPEPYVLVDSTSNLPFAPADSRDASYIMKAGLEAYIAGDDISPGMSSLRRTLLHNWKYVGSETRKD